MFATVQSLLWVIASSMTSPHMLYWSVWRWSFDGECVEVTLGHNVEYTWSMSIRTAHVDARMLKRRPPGEGGHAKEDRNLAFSGGRRSWNWLKFSWNNHDPQAYHFQGVHFLGPLAPCASRQKLRVQVERLLSSVMSFVCGWVLYTVSHHVLLFFSPHRT